MPRARTPKACKRCGEAGLFWKSFDGSWRLSTPEGLLHVCNQPPREFPTSSTEPAEPSEPVDPEVSTDAGAALYGLIKPHLDRHLSTLTVSSNGNGHHEPTTVVVTLPDETEPATVIEGAHKQTPTLIRYLSLGLPVMLVGPAGSGKTHAAEQAADALGLKFYPQSVGGQTSKTDLLGYIDAHGKPVRTILREAYEHGGVFLLDEIDAGNANVLTILNAALANDYCSFPDAVVHKHPDFRCIAAGNTYGNGASRQYVGRNQLDAATLNRFVVIDWQYDQGIEQQIAAAHGATSWASYVWRLREAQANTGVRVILSTRAILYGSKLLAAGIGRDEVEQAVLWASVSPDDRAKLQAA